MFSLGTIVVAQSSDDSGESRLKTILHREVSEPQGTWFLQAYISGCTKKSYLQLSSVESKSSDDSSDIPLGPAACL